MARPLLTTRLHIHRVRPEEISQPRLIEWLNTGLNGKLTLIVPCLPPDPAGAGGGHIGSSVRVSAIDH
jgi:hypothetical protein